MQLVEVKQNPYTHLESEKNFSDQVVPKNSDNFETLKRFSDIVITASQYQPCYKPKRACIENSKSITRGSVYSPGRCSSNGSSVSGTSVVEEESAPGVVPNSVPRRDSCEVCEEDVALDMSVIKSTTNNSQSSAITSPPNLTSNHNIIHSSRSNVMSSSPTMAATMVHHYSVAPTHHHLTPMLCRAAELSAISPLAHHAKMPTVSPNEELHLSGAFSSPSSMILHSGAPHISPPPNSSGFPLSHSPSSSGDSSSASGMDHMTDTTSPPLPIVAMQFGHSSSPNTSVSPGLMPQHMLGGSSSVVGSSVNTCPSPGRSGSIVSSLPGSSPHRYALHSKKKAPQPIPKECKDEAYWERRKRNNESAKRSRELRRIKEQQTTLRVFYLEQENIQLRTELGMLRSEVDKLRSLLYNNNVQQQNNTQQQQQQQQQHQAPNGSTLCRPVAERGES